MVGIDLPSTTGRLAMAKPAAVQPTGAPSYWERLREPAALIQRDLALLLANGAGGAVLDVGCGAGTFVACCRRAGIDAFGLEPFSAAAAVARRNGAPPVLGTGESLPFETRSLDAVRMKEVLEHVADPLAFVTEARRVLKTNGTFIAYVPSQWSMLYPFPANFFDDYTHVRAFSRIGMARLLEDAGFLDIRVQGYTPPLRWWQWPVSEALSRVFPFLWRATAVAL